MEGLSLKEAKAYLEGLLAQGELELFFQAVKPRLRLHSTARDTFTLQEAHLNRLKKNAARGLAKQEDLDMGYRQITNSLLMAVRMMKERDMV